MHLRAALFLLLLLVPAAVPAEEPPPPPPPPEGALAAVPDELWVAREGRREKLSREELLAAIGRGEIGRDTLVWVDGRWVRAGDVAFLRPLFAREEQVVIRFVVPPDTPDNRRALVRELARELELRRTLETVLDRFVRELAAEIARALPPAPGRERVQGRFAQVLHRHLVQAAWEAAADELVEGLARALSTGELAFQLALSRHPLVTRTRERLAAVLPGALQEAARRFAERVGAQAGELCAALRDAAAESYGRERADALLADCEAGLGREAGGAAAAPPR